MGLDMYLYKKTYVQNWNHTAPTELHQVSVKLNKKKVKHIKPERVSYIIEQVGYWRKANQIHKWFVDKCQEGEDDCRTGYVPTEKLKELLDLCKKIKENPSEGHTLLPSTGGFFFGSTDYDEYYYHDIDKTIEILETVLGEDVGNSCVEYNYHSSW